MLFVSEKVDEINYLQKKLVKLGTQIHKKQWHINGHSSVGSVIVCFNKIVTVACQINTSEWLQQIVPHHLGGLYNIVWNNLFLSLWQCYIHSMLVFVIASVLNITWTVPIAMTGLVSQITYMTALSSWTEWILDLPGRLLDFLQRSLPQLLLTALITTYSLILKLLM